MSYRVTDKCIKSVHYGVFSGPNTGKYGPKKTPFLDIFHAVGVIKSGMELFSPEKFNTLHNIKLGFLF